jgi:hypothetical protein
VRRKTLEKLDMIDPITRCRRNEGMRLLEMAMISGDGEAQIIFLARNGSASSNHVRGRSELDNFEKERWSIAGGRHLPVNICQLSD